MPKPDNFNEAIESFTNYKERLDAYFLANDIAQAKQSAVLLSALGPKVYGILRSLTAPDLPTTKSYNQLCQKDLGDRFVCGFSDVAIQKRLLQERDLAFDNATNMALAMETAHHDAGEIQGSTFSPLHVMPSMHPQKNIKISSFHLASLAARQTINAKTASL
ncbi:hypothetical protein RRG08_024032 [Elysia crispata]|uniref:Uncharacterized protein n=1 Tax=Elysia crispata TaxID=231223 RepID=A0AAE0Z8P1_9GAST|nr:hypothetical protein RRG08_024032 [Elysia crispata]